MLMDIDHTVKIVLLAGFAIFPLPAKKILWEARNASTWRAQFSETLKDRIFRVINRGISHRDMTIT